MTRSVGLTLRRTARGSVIFALGLGALSSIPRQLVPISAVASTGPITAAPAVTEPMLHPAMRPRAIIYEQATPPPMAAATVSAPAAQTPLRRLTAAPAIAPARAAGPVTGTANGFSYGYCTWWVAHKRYVPWRGNAAEWWWNARPFGYAEGSAPRPGSIMVMGISATSPQGHVAYVESVNPDGSFVVSEMNWWGVPGGGWNRVDYRTVTSMRGILGFIY